MGTHVFLWGKAVLEPYRSSPCLWTLWFSNCPSGTNLPHKMQTVPFLGRDLDERRALLLGGFFLDFIKTL
jgi:hypothetical protein